MPDARQFNKIAPPRINRTIPRRHLFDLLERNDHQASAVWVAGPAGAGKTSLVAGNLAACTQRAIWYQVDAGDGDLSTFFYYLGRAAAPALGPPPASLPPLTPEYLMGVETFAIPYFENLFQHLRTPAWIVFDNFQELPSDSPVPAIVARAVELAPHGIRLALISRHDPPPVMARLLANREMTVIGGDRLAFSPDECRKLIDVLDVAMPAEEAARLHRATRGWAAGLILWLLHRQTGAEPHEAVVDDMPASVFDYFAGEVLQKTDDTTRQFLLQTALMPHMTAETAGRLTGMPAAEILDRLSRRNFFLERRQLETDSYQYHPLFRNFLKHRTACMLNDEDINSLIRRAAAIMAASGQGEEAVDLYQQAKDFQAMTGLILSQAPALIAQGRNRTLTGWIDGLPEDLVDHQPWLLFWNGVALIASRPEHGQSLIIRAFERFKQARDLMGQIMSWSSIVESSLYLRGTLQDMDRWAGEGERLGTSLPPNLDPGIGARFSASMLVALLLNNPCHPLLGHWQDRCEELLRQCPNQQVSASMGINLLWSYDWLGQHTKARQLKCQLEAMLAHDDLSPMTWLSFQWCQAICSLEEGALSQAHRIIRDALDFADRSGVQFFDFLFLAFGAYGSLFDGDLHAARNYLDRAAQIVPPHATWDIAQHHFLEGFLAMTAGDWSRAKNYLNSGPRLAVLCAEALKNRIHPDIVADLIRRLQLPPPPIDQAGEAWPWPLKVYVLGRLRILGQDQPLDLGVKPPKKPLELLRVLICRNGQRISREALADHLWPDADGDRAVQNLNTALHRLRKLLGSDQAVRVESGHLDLNPSLC